jgi:hypothetical protein
MNTPNIQFPIELEISANCSSFEASKKKNELLNQFKIHNTHNKQYNRLHYTKPMPLKQALNIYVKHKYEPKIINPFG